MRDESFETPSVIGGLGEMKSNSGTMCHPANIPGGSYRYLVEIKDEEYTWNDYLTIETIMKLIKKM